ncbi:MAG: helix-turn-helix domain-containing protein [Eubacterium sp.]
MSIKQGDYLKELRIKNNFSQEKLGEQLGLSRQSISKWEQGYALPDTENLLKLSQLYHISVDAILKCGETDAPEKESAEAVKETEETDKKEVRTEVIVVERPAHTEQKEHKKRGWFFVSYPVFMVIAYVIIGCAFGAKGWITGWLVLLTIPLFYTGIIAAEKRKPIIFCYPVLTALIYLAGGFFAQLWHPLWIIFLTIPIFYIVCALRKIK